MNKMDSLWNEFKILVESLENDMGKNIEKANVSAGIRMRKGLREGKRLIADMIRESVKADKQTVEDRKTANKAEKEAKKNG